MKIEIKADGVWHHGSNVLFSELRTNSTITQWKELAEAFSHKPSALGYDDDSVIRLFRKGRTEITGCAATNRDTIIRHN